LTNGGKNAIVRGFPNQAATGDFTLANTLQSRKRARQSEKRRQHNASLRSRLRTRIKAVSKAIDKGDKETAQSAFKDAVSVIDKTASKGLIHKNSAARTKSRLNNRLRALS
jgi:small subunit ribosomal protein S20